MRYALQINQDPVLTITGEQAFRFANELLVEGHELIRVFFYHQAVAYAFSHDPRQTAFRPDWSALARDYRVDLVACVSAALRRGWLNESNLTPDYLLPGFRVAGLGQWAEAVALADQVKVFG